MKSEPFREMQFRLLPFLFALYVVAFIDRINLGSAALTMNRELAITSQQFGLAAGVFFWDTSSSRSPVTSSFIRSGHVSG
jgi:ACS family tartrate transporter-like MFS transporter